MEMISIVYNSLKLKSDYLKYSLESRMVKIIQIGLGSFEEYKFHISKKVEQVICIEHVPYLVTINKIKIDTVNYQRNRKDRIFHELLGREINLKKKFKVDGVRSFDLVVDEKEITDPCIELTTQTLDHFLEIKNMNSEEYECLIIRDQGMECDILLGAENYLKSAKCVQFSLNKSIKGGFIQIKEYLENKRFIVEEVSRGDKYVRAYKPGFESYKYWMI